MNRRLVSAVLSLLLPLAGIASAAAAECVPVARQAWIRLPPSAAMPMMAGFARIENPCSVAVTITGAESLAFAEVSLHESREVDGVNRMREIEALPIAAGKAVEFKPGGLHLMLFRPYQPLEADDTVVISLKLQDGRSVPVSFRALPYKAAP